MRFSIKALLGFTVVIAIILTVIRAYDIAHVSQQEAAQVKLGMTPQNVVAILGEPHWSQNERHWGYVCDFPHWLSDNLHIYFDEHGKVEAITR